MFLPLGYYNNQFLPVSKISIPPTDLGIHRGYSVFDFLKFVDLKNPWSDLYMDRLQNSCNLVGIKMPFSKNEILSLSKSVLTQNNLRNGYAKILISAGPSDNGYNPSGNSSILILGIPITLKESKVYLNGGHLITTHYKRDIPEVKSTNYLGSLMELDKLKNEEAIDILFRQNDIVTETSRCSFYIVIDNQVITAADGILKGITRHRILQLKNIDFEIITRNVLFSEIHNASEAFVSSTTKGVMPITSIDNLQIGNGKVGPVTHKLMHLIDAF